MTIVAEVNDGRIIDQPFGSSQEEVPLAIFESLANTLKILAVGDRVKVTLRPETLRFPNPTEGKILEKDDSGNFSLQTEQGVIGIKASDILSVTRLKS